MKKTFFYKLIDPRCPDIPRYIGRADRPGSRLSGHIRDATKDGSKHTPKSIWIKTLLDAGVRPELIVIDELEYSYTCEWSDREMHHIAKHFYDGYPLENASPGGVHPFCHNIHAEWLSIWEEDKSDYNKFKLDEAEMFYESNDLSSNFEKAWVLRRNFWTGKDDYISWFQLELARLDWIRMKLKVMGAKYCSFCGTSMDLVLWESVKHKFPSVTDIIEMYSCSEELKMATSTSNMKSIYVDMKEYGGGWANCSEFNKMLSDALHMKNYIGDYFMKSPDGAVIICDCEKSNHVYFRMNSPVRKIKSYDLNYIFNSDMEEFMKTYSEK